MNNYLNQAITAIRVAGIEAVSQANSGHPGIVLGAAPILATLYANHMNFDVSNPHYFNRDRFVLSAGHGSALLYALFAALKIPGANVSELKNFRQLNSVYAGHPERDLLAGVEMTTGPLGQGVASAVGMAIAEAHLHAMFKTQNSAVVDHYTYCLFGDGCMQEGIFHEALSIASYYNLKKLILLYDSNDIQLDGPTKNSECINKQKYFEALNFDYQLVLDGNDPKAIDTAIALAKTTDKPSIIEIKTIIGLYSPKANSASVHGAPLSKDEIAVVRKNLNYNFPSFTYDQDVYAAFLNFHSRSQNNYQKYLEAEKQLEQDDSKKAELFKKIKNNQFCSNFISTVFEQLSFDHEASRNIVGKIYQHVMNANPTFITLNADLSCSTKIIATNKSFASANDHGGVNWNVGVRELAMQALLNGITAHGGMLGVGSTFLAFADYTKPAMRLGAINKLKTLTVFSHDSISVGEDGPTHQPIEQLAMFRATPEICLCRPSNLEEAVYAFVYWIKHAKAPVVITTSRAAYKVPKVDLNQIENIEKGAYVVYKKAKEVDLSLLATGSEVAVAIAVADELAKHNVHAEVISVWSWEIYMNFLATNQESESIFSSDIRFSIEYGSTMGWEFFDCIPIGIDEFGKSAPADQVAHELEVDVNAIVELILETYAFQINDVSDELES